MAAGDVDDRIDDVAEVRAEAAPVRAACYDTNSVPLLKVQPIFAPLAFTCTA